MRVVWSKRSREHIAALHAYVANHDPAAVDRVANRIIELTGTLFDEQPNAGRPGRVSGTRELVITKTPYIVAYRTDDSGVTVLAVLAVLHGSRSWPNIF